MPANAAKDRAAYYVQHFGSAVAALKVVDQPGHNDAFEREVNQELRALASAETIAHRAATGRTWIDDFRDQQAAEAAEQARRAVALAAQNAPVLAVAA